MKIKSEVSREEIEKITPRLKKAIVKQSKGILIHSWLWILCVTPFCYWLFHMMMRSLRIDGWSSWTFIFDLVLAMITLLLNLIVIIFTIYYPVYLKIMPREDTTFEIELTKAYKKSIRQVVILADYIFIHSFYKRKTRYFILKNDDTSLFDELRRELVPRGKSKLKYKCFEDKGTE